MDVYYQIVYLDKFPAAQAPAARERIRRRFRLSAAQINHLSSGRPVVVKRGLSLSEARRYQRAIRGAGGLCWLQPVTADGRFRDRRRGPRRKLPDRRGVFRASAILPDRRCGRGRRASDGA